MLTDQVTVIPWTHSQPPTEANIRQQLNAEGLRPYQWGNAPGDTYGAHTHTYHKVIYVISGSITFGLPELNEEVVLKVGDRLELAAGILHSAVVGPKGVICLEAHR